MSAQQSRYSDVNKERLQKIEQEILATRMSLLEADQKRKAIREQVLAAQNERQKKNALSPSMDRNESNVEVKPQSKPMA